MNKKTDISKIHDLKQLRNFGLIWSLIFTIIAFYPLLKGQSLRMIPLYIALFFFTISAAYPQIYKITYFYQGWIKFGNVIGKINSKIIIFLLFYGIFTPVSLVLRVLGKDLLNKKIDKSKKSYFISCEEEIIDMKHQF